ncbi:cyclopropane-fatty-acyl-phospholipid synthase [Chaetomidium leptoderma]|uniref:Cyclopropane-fatty-acyl-phospholipid synthase n=1 Tax=Chaetomidium leptoderma TaxID=669021 RepID=A0AAN6VUV6_9PEZI|nr:cyclopropane-fatty-acyl-phospholipid synthase [Chaetomidium leptoderma]
MLPGFVSRPLSRAAAYLCDKLTSPALALARPAILSLLSSIKVGTLILIDEPLGERHIFGQPLDEEEAASTTPGSSTTHPSSNPETTKKKKTTTTTQGTTTQDNPPPPCATLTIKSPTFYLRLLLLSPSADMGFAAAYLLGEATCPDLTSLFRLFILNRAHLNNMTTANGTTASWCSSSGNNNNTVANAAVNAAAHYDLGNDMFAAFLSGDMTYSCPIWRLDDDGLEGETLEEAQRRKLRRFVEGARLKSGDHVLEIGTGWGSFAIEAVKATGCRVTTLTLSREQKVLAEERIAAEGLAGRIEVLLMDYRALPVPPERPYDKVVSIEMLEAVGKEFLGTYFACVDKLLKRDGGVAMFQCITMPEGRHEAYSRSEDFINHYIFPGGYLPSITQLLNHISTESKGTLIVEKVENIGGHYARTLRLWREQFIANFEDKIRPALMKEHPDMRKNEVDVFRRKWEYYFTYCEAGFLTKTLGDVIITVGREGAMELMEGIPL